MGKLFITMNKNMVEIARKMLFSIGDEDIKFGKLFGLIYTKKVRRERKMKCSPSWKKTQI